MRRQLYRGGGIASLPRQGYGIGSWVKERIRKLIPNELADVAVKAAPFVAMIPGQQGTAALMRGIGRFDQRGSISDALKQGALTYGFGKYAAPSIREGVGGLYEGAKSKIGAWSGPEGGFKQKAKELAFGKEPTWSKSGAIRPGTGVLEGGTKGLLGAGGDFNLKESFGKGLPAVFAGSTLASLAIQKAMGDVGGREAGESLTAFNKRRESTVANYLAYYYKRANKFRIAPEELEEKTAEFVRQNTTEYRTGESEGGRIGYQAGGISMGNTLAQNIAANQAQAEANKRILEQGRSRLPGYIAPTPQVSAPAAAGAAPAAEAQITSASAAPMTMDMTGPEVTGFDYSQPTDWSPGQAAPEGYRVENMLGDTFLERMYPSKEEMGMMPGPMGLPGMGPGNLAPYTPTTAPFEKYGITEDQYAMMSPEDQAAVWRRVDRDQGIWGDNIGKSIWGIPESEWSSYGKTYNQGGRVGYAIGSPEKQLEAGAPSIIYEGDMRPNRRAQGGRIGQLYGTGPAGLPGIPRMAPDGLEYDMRENGGFQGLGAKEGKDDVNAKLAKNEFVFTADAVRGAGGGDIELGAQKMYDTMKNLERRMA